MSKKPKKSAEKVKADEALAAEFCPACGCRTFDGKVCSNCNFVIKPKRK